MAVDPLEENFHARKHVIESLGELSRQGASIYPVYVLSPVEYRMNLEFNTSWIKQLLPTAMKMLLHYLENTKISALIEPKVLMEKSPSLSASVGSLLYYAKRMKADMIVVGTHGRKGASRFFWEVFRKRYSCSLRFQFS